MTWNWLSFFVGVLVGWLVEWLIDYFFWRSRRRALLEENAELQTQLDSATSRNEQLEAQVTRGGANVRAKEEELNVAASRLSQVQASAEIMQERLESQEKRAIGREETLAAREDEVAALSEKLSSTEMELEASRAERVDVGLRTQALEVQLSQVQAEVENLEERLAAEEKRAATCEEALRAKEGELAIPSERLSPAGMTLEASRAGDIDEEGRGPALGAQVEETKTDVSVVVEPDDLLKIEGIGPKIAGILQDNDILTYAQLADAPVGRLHEILQGAGPRYRLADPASWPEQARLAAEERWEELQDLQDRLSGGRTSDGPELTR